METFVAIFLIVLSIALAAMMAFDVIRQRVELLSVRNFFLLGFILFQNVAAVIPLVRNYYPRYPVERPATTSLKYAILVSVFLGLFILLHRSGPFVKKLARHMPRNASVAPVSKVLALAGICVVLGTVMRFGVQIPLIGILANFTAMALAGAAAGLAGWVWGPRLMNPAVATISVAIILASLAIVITGTYSRRGLVSVCACVGWGMYFSHFKYVSKTRYLPYLTMVTAVGVIFIALFTSVRGTAHRKDFNPIEYAQLILTEGNLMLGMLDLAGGQETGHVSMWLMERYPDHNEYEDLLGLAYTFMVPIPRGWWVDKPVPISLRIPYIAGLRRVERGQLTIGPGIIGTAWVDGGWWPIFLYAAFFALTLGLLDEWCRLNPYDITVVLPVGAAVGQVLAIPRGEVGLFAFMYFYSVISSWLVLWLAAKFMRLRGEAAPIAHAQPARAHDAQLLENEEEMWPDEVWTEPSPTHRRLDWAELGEGEAFEAEMERSPS